MANPPTVTKIPLPAAPKPPSPGAKPSLVFTTCTMDATEIAKLPKQTADRPKQQTKQLGERTAAWFAGAPAYSRGNSVIPYIYGRCAFDDIADALATATSDQHRIYLVGWWVEPWTRLKNPLTGPPPINPLLQDYLRSSRAQVRALFWDTPRKGEPGDNAAIVQFINSIPNGAAIEDGKLVPGDLPHRGPNAHHQKLLVVSGTYGLIAFLGGMDLNNSRVDVGGFNPLHDVHVRITGPAAIACLAVFRDRWLDHPASSALDRTKFQMAAADVSQDFAKVASTPPRPLESVTLPDGKMLEGRLLVSIGKTYPVLSKFKPNDSYSFAKSGEQSAWQLVKNGIVNARRFIYCEDQYLVSRRARAELVKKIKEPGFKFLLILMGNSAHFENDAQNIFKNEFPYLISARNEFRTDLSVVDPNRKKWRMFSLKPASDPQRQLWCGDFVHSKLWICDDDYVAVGSANCDDRGYTYDTEIMAAITEEPSYRVADGSFGRDLRVALWHKHLGVPHSHLQSFAKGLQFWFSPPPSAMVMDASALEVSPLIGTTLIRSDPSVEYAWTHLIDPDADKL